MKLKPCPFCGGNNVNIVPFGFTKVTQFIECDDCGASVRPCIDESEVIAAWNQRYNEPPMIDEVPNLDSQKREVQA